MHEQCVLDDGLRATYKRLGTDKPHVPPVTPKKEEDGDEGKRPLSPSETGAEGSAEQSIDVKSEAAPSDAVHVGTTDTVEARQTDDEDAPAAPEDSLPVRTADQQRATTENTPSTSTPNKGTATALGAGRKPGRPRKKGVEANGEGARPWEGLFEATLITTDIGPPTIEIRDVRDGIVGGEKTWIEPVKCLICGDKVN